MICSNSLERVGLTGSWASRSAADLSTLVPHSCSASPKLDGDTSEVLRLPLSVRNLGLQGSGIV